jgi:type II secretory pathway pseudopilin PulG
MNRNHRGHVRGGEGGFSLVEVAVSFGVIAVALLGAMSMMVQASVGKEAHRELQVAKEAALSAHEELKAQTAGSSKPVLDALQEHLQARYGAPSTQVVDGRTCFVTTFPVAGLSWSEWTPSSGGSSRQGRATVTLDPTNAELVPVTIQIDWKSVGRNSGYSLSSLYAGGFFQ